MPVPIPLMSRSSWALLLLLTLSINGILCWSVVYVAQPKSKVVPLLQHGLRLVTESIQSEPELELSSQKSEMPSILSRELPSPPIATILPVDLTSHLMINTSPIVAPLMETPLFSTNYLTDWQTPDQPNLAPMVLEAYPVLQIAPLYPSQALVRGIEGQITLEFSIDAMGIPYAIQVIAEQPSGYFKQATLRAFRRWRFPVEPQSAQVRYQYTVTYKIDK